MTFNPATTAVLAVHFQKDVVTPDGAFGGFFAEQAQTRGVVAKAATILDAARAAGLTVVYTRVGWDAGHKTLVANNPLLGIVAQQGCLVNGTWQTEILDELPPAESDFVLTNERVSSFADSPLDSILRGKGIDTVIVFGVATNLSVEDTARHASNLGYRVLLVEDASSAASQAAHQATVESLGLLGEITTTAEVTSALAPVPA